MGSRDRFTTLGNSRPFPDHFGGVAAFGAFAFVALVTIGTLATLALNQQGFETRFGLEPMCVWIGPGVGLIACLLGPRRLGIGAFTTIVTVGLLAAWLLCRATTMGDSIQWRNVMATERISLAETGSSLAYRLVFSIAPAAVDFVAPCLGTVATVLWLRCNQRAAAPDAVHERLRMAALAWLSSGILAAFFRGYVEHTQLGVLFLVLALGQLRSTTPIADAEAGASTRSLARFGLWIGVAGFTHLHYVGFAPVAFVVCLAQPWPFVRRLTTGAALTLLPILMTGGGIALVHLAGAEFSMESFHGGSGSLWMPLVSANGWFAPGTLLSPDRLSLTAGVLCFAAPTWIVALPLLVWSARGGGARRLLEPLLPAAAYLTLMAGFEFDLGWPRDIDLMVASSPALLWLILEGLGRRQPGSAAPMLVIGLWVPLSVVTWLLIAPLVRPVGDSPRQANSEAASLTVGDTIAPGGPVRIARPGTGDRVPIAVRAKPGATFFVLQGTKAPGAIEHPYDGSWDIAHPGRFEETPVVVTGTIGPDGWFRCEIVWDDAQRPANIGWQAIVLDPRLHLTAAYYFEDR